MSRPLDGLSAIVTGAGRGLTTSTALAPAKYGVTANAICPRARTRMTEDVLVARGPRWNGRDRQTFAAAEVLGLKRAG